MPRCVPRRTIHSSAPLHAPQEKRLHTPPREQALSEVPGQTAEKSLARLLKEITPLLAKDFAPGFRAAFWGDTMVVHLLRRHNAALREAWVARGWFPHGATLAAVEADMLDLGLVCANYSVELHGTSGCFLSLSIEQVKEAFVDSLDLSIGALPPLACPRPPYPAAAPPPCGASL